MANNTDFDIKCYFTPDSGIPFGNTQGWKRPYELAYLNISLPADTTPGVHQYVAGTRFEDGKTRAHVDSIELVKTLDQGSWAHIELMTHSDRDIFEIVPNEGTGQMMPRMKFPYRCWEVNLKAKDDSSFPSPALFRGMLTEYSVQALSDVKIADQQDGVFRIALDLESFETFNLRKDIGASLWHHRANSTTDGYHWGFFAFDNLTFDQIITRIVAWMNAGRPTTDFPVTYTYTPKGVAPYSTNIFDPIAGTMTGTVTFTNGSTAVTGSGTMFTTELSVGQLIRPHLNAGQGWTGWGKISSITDNTNLTLTANYAGTSRSGDTGDYNRNTIAIAECKDRPTWDVLRDVLNYMGALEGAGLKYIPTCDINGVIDVTYGGFDKTATPYTDFRDQQVMNKNTSTAVAFNFPLIDVEFTGVNDAEYRIKFWLYKWNGSGWDTVATIPESGYEYVPYDMDNTHSRKWYSFPLQGAGTYKWDTDMVVGINPDTGLPGQVGIIESDGGGYAYSAADYNFISSPVKVKYGNLRTFAMTQGKCSQVSIVSSTNVIGCWDGGLGTGGFGYNKCPDTMGCYPDPHPSIGESVNAKYGILGVAASYSDISEQNSVNTLCRLNSKRIYECHLNTGSKIREPLEFEIRFNDGHTDNLIGRYVDFYSFELDDVVMGRVTEQKHVLKGNRVTTTIRGFRV